MRRRVQTEVFVWTLGELLAAARSRRLIRMRLQRQAKAERSMKMHRAERDDSLRPSEWTLRSKQAAQQDAWQNRGK
jgi:hypothetical protein